MPKTSAIEEELDDGGFIARSGKPLPQFAGGSIHSSLLGSRNHRRNYGAKEPQGPPPPRRQEPDIRQSQRMDIIENGTMSKPTVDEKGVLTSGKNQMVTLSGTIKRGRRQDQVIEVQFQIPEKDLKKMTDAKKTEKNSRSIGCGRGPHVVFLTLLFCPFAFVTSLFTTFYVGTLCWYNIYLYMSEERTVWHKVFFCPLLLIFYPAIITVLTLCLSVVAAVKQVSWSMSNWCNELRDFDKGFFVWLCNALGIPQCAPYEVVILNEAPVTENIPLEQNHKTETLDIRGSEPQERNSTIQEEIRL